MTFIPPAIGQWHEYPVNNGPALPLVALVPYKTSAGYWVLVERGTQPAGATQGAAVSGASYDTLVTTTTTGLRIVRTPAGYLVKY